MLRYIKLSKIKLRAENDKSKIPLARIRNDNFSVFHTVHTQTHPHIPSKSSKASRHSHFDLYPPTTRAESLQFARKEYDLNQVTGTIV